MALSKIDPDREKVEELAFRLKELLEATILRDPSLNDKEALEIKKIRTELEEMGLWVVIEYSMDLNEEDPLKSKITANINLWIPRNTTVH